MKLKISGPDNADFEHVFNTVQALEIELDFGTGTFTIRQPGQTTVSGEIAVSDKITFEK